MNAFQTNHLEINIYMDPTHMYIWHTYVYSNTRLYIYIYIYVGSFSEGNYFKAISYFRRCTVVVIIHTDLVPLSIISAHLFDLQSGEGAFYFGL